MAQRTSNPRNVRRSLKRPGNVAGYSDTKRVIFPAVEAAEIFESLKFLAFTAPYDALLTAQEVASLMRESSNQLLETLEEWNDYLEHYPPLVLQERPP